MLEIVQMHPKTSQPHIPPTPFSCSLQQSSWKELSIYVPLRPHPPCSLHPIPPPSPHHSTKSTMLKVTDDLPLPIPMAGWLLSVFVLPQSHSWTSFYVDRTAPPCLCVDVSYAPEAHRSRQSSNFGASHPLLPQRAHSREGQTVHQLDQAKATASPLIALSSPSSHPIHQEIVSTHLQTHPECEHCHPTASTPVRNTLASPRPAVPPYLCSVHAKGSGEHGQQRTYRRT